MTSKLTREENVQAVFDLKAGYTLGLADVEILKRVARMALVAMDSEPVAWISQSNLDALSRGHDAMVKSTDNVVQPVPLYRHAQPAPDVVGKLLAILDRHTVELGWGEKPITLAELVIARDGSDELNACRAAIAAATQEEKQ